MIHALKTQLFDQGGSQDTATTLSNVKIDLPRGFEHASTFLELFYLRERHHPDKTYLFQAQGDSWQEMTWAEVGKQARQIAQALRDLGLKPGDHVGLLSKNCCQWFVADLAIMMGGYVSVPFYPTLNAEDLNEVIKLSGIKALFVGKLEHWEEQASGVPKKVDIIRFPHYPGNSQVNTGLNWNTLLNNTPEIAEPHQPAPNELFTILYTSGTTGTPKGVMLSYDCPMKVLQQELKQPVYGLFQGVAQRIISYLPLNHIAERMASEMISIAAGSEVYFSESLDRFAANLQAVQPTQFFAVPRIWVKMQQGVLSKLPQKKLDAILRIPLLGRLLKTKIRKGLGLNEVRAALSGAAPLPASVLLWFRKLGIEIQEVYGATETCGGVTFNALDDIAPGTVGRPVPGTEIVLDSETNEILVNAPWNMLGYYKEEKKTKETLVDGYYRTGDVGRFDAQGRLIITGRIKDTFKTAKGKFVLPVPIEQRLAKDPNIEQVCVCGIGLAQPIAIICLSESAQGKSQEEIGASLMQSLQSVNAGSNAHEKISHAIVLETAWDDSSGFLTPTMKVKRHIVHEYYQKYFETWTAQNKVVIWHE